MNNMPDKVTSVRKDGSAVPRGHCYSVDSTADLFIISFHSLRGVSKAQLKRILQEKGGLKVNKIEHPHRQFTAV